MRKNCQLPIANKFLIGWKRWYIVVFLWSPLANGPPKASLLKKNKKKVDKFALMY